MMEATGLEPDTGKNAKLSNRRQNQSSNGHNKLQEPTGESDAKGTNVDLLSKNDQNMSNPGRHKNITRAECEHNMSRMEFLFDANLMKVIEAWDELPKAIRHGILAMVKKFSE